MIAHVDYVHLMSDDHNIRVVVAVFGFGSQRLSVLFDELRRARWGADQLVLEAAGRLKYSRKEGR